MKVYPAVEGEKAATETPEGGKEVEGKGLPCWTASADAVVVCRQRFFKERKN